MHFLNLLFISCSSIPFCYSQFNLFFAEQQELDHSLHLGFDQTLFLDEPIVGDTSSVDLITELNSNLFSDQETGPYHMPELESSLFPDDNVGLNPMIGSEQSSILTDDISCGAGIANHNDIQLFRKARRRDFSCSVFLVGEALQPFGSNEESQFDLDKLIQFLKRPIPVFEPSPDICSSMIYGLSNTPVCEVPGITNVAGISSPIGSVLQSVYSGMLLYDLCLVVRRVLLQLCTNKAHPVTKDPIGCQDAGAKIWCCSNVAPRTELNLPPEKLNEVQAICPFLTPPLSRCSYAKNISFGY